MRWSLGLFLFAACGGGGSTGPNGPSNQAGGDTGFVVWSRHGDTPPTSRWLDASGGVRGQAAGIYVVHGGKLARVERTEVKVPLTGCEMDGDKPPEPTEGEGVQLTLVDVTGGGRLELNDAANAEDGQDLGELSQFAVVSGGVGRLLTIEEGQSTYGCGAHGNNDVLAGLFDLSTGTSGPFPFRAEVEARMKASTLARFHEDEEIADATEALLGESMTTWRDGKVAMRHLFYVDACYACGNGVWSSYTSGRWFDDAQVPEPFAAEAALVPAPVAAALSALVAAGTEDEPVDTGVSWGTPGDDWRATFK